MICKSFDFYKTAYELLQLRSVISSFLKLKKERCVVASQHVFAFKDCRDQLFDFTSASLFARWRISAAQYCVVSLVSWF